MVNRINVNVSQQQGNAILVFDQGKEVEYTRLIRRLGVHNPIPSKFGSWGTAGPTKNIPTGLIVEDPFFKRSDRSYFIQAVDFCAYALLQRERPLPSKVKYGLDKSFNVLTKVLERRAAATDPDGIIRP